MPVKQWINFAEVITASSTLLGFIHRIVRIVGPNFRHVTRAAAF